MNTSAHTDTPAETRDDKQSVRPHSVTAKAIHWGFTGFFIYALTKQLDEVDELEDMSLLEYEMVFATIFLALLLARFFFMQSTRPSALPADTPKKTKLLARAVHLGMYACLALIAVTGLSIGGLYWSGTKSGDAMDLVLLLHEIAVNSSYFLILGHIAAAVYHRRKGDGLWDSMVPVWQESNKTSASSRD